MKKMFKLVKGGKKEEKSGSGTPSGDELDDDQDSAMYCYKIDSETEEKMGRLLRASWHGSLEKVKTLLQKKPTDVNAVDSFGRTPLHLAMAKGYYNIAWVLLNHNASLDNVDCDGYTPFLKVSLLKYGGSVQFLNNNDFEEVNNLVEDVFYSIE